MLGSLTGRATANSSRVSFLLKKDKSSAVSKDCEKQFINNKRKSEIISFSNELNSFGISFSTMASTKYDKESSLEIAKIVANDKELFNYLITNKKLPLSVLEDNHFTKKFLKKNQKYIIGLTLLIKGDYDYLQDYLSKGI